MVLAVMAVVAMADDNNNVFQLFQDTRIQKSDGFTFGIVFSLYKQCPTCDVQPKVDQISLITINTTPETYVEGTLQNLYGKRNGFASCKGNPNLAFGERERREVRE
ncbi:hypothetical protein AMTRI_Chr05g60600 [Amborella trichopoda]